MNLASVVFDQAILVSAVVLLFEGAFLLARRRSFGLRFLSIGIAIAALTIGLAYSEYRSAAYFGDQFVPRAEASRKLTEREIDGSWANALPVGQREEKTRAYASVAYINEGKIVKYFTVSEGWRAYCPTPEDVQKREQLVSSEARLTFAAEMQRERASNHLNRAWSWLAAALLAASFGWSMGAKRRSVDN